MCLGDRASGHRRLLAEGLHLLLSLGQHVPVLRALLLQGVQLGSHIQVPLRPRPTLSQGAKKLETQTLMRIMTSRVPPGRSLDSTPLRCHVPSPVPDAESMQRDRPSPHLPESQSADQGPRAHPCAGPGSLKGRGRSQGEPHLILELHLDDFLRSQLLLPSRSQPHTGKSQAW